MNDCEIMERTTDPLNDIYIIQRRQRPKDMIPNLNSFPLLLPVGMNRDHEEHVKNTCRTATTSANEKIPILGPLGDALNMLLRNDPKNIGSTEMANNMFLAFRWKEVPKES